MRDAERRQRIEHGVDDGGTGADGAGLARALDAERVGGAGHAVDAEVDDGTSLARGRRVIDERAGEKLRRVAVVDGVLEQRLADSLRDAARKLGPRAAAD